MAKGSRGSGSQRSRRKRPAGKATTFELGAMSAFEIAAAMDRVAKLVARAIGEIAREHGATPGQLHVVERLARSPEGLTAKQLAAALAIRPGSLTGMLDGLEARAVLRREVVKGDARQQRIVLLEGAQELVALIEQADTVVDELLGNPEFETVERLAETVRELEGAARTKARLPTPTAIRARRAATPGGADVQAVVTPIAARIAVADPEPDAGLRTGTDHWAPNPDRRAPWRPPPRHEEGSLGRGLFRIASRVLSAADSLGRGHS